MPFRTDRVRAIVVLKARDGLSSDDIRARVGKMMDSVKALAITQENLLKYEVSVKAERPIGTLAGEMGLRETEFSVMVILEAASHDALHETLTNPEYRQLLSGTLEHFTTTEDFHIFPAEFMTCIDK
ncbi:hypothetical protein C8R45DRAFT_630289 [Mycena sanguinolenta]|nr:hypothetical protein C8R45DRAFT_630289 [Mycena sanguinolenta]